MIASRGVSWIARVLRPRAVAIAAVLALPCFGALGAETAQAPQLQRSVFPAIGEQQTILTVGEFGRYALLAHSEQGTALELVGRMTGPGGAEGEPGAADGRIDAFLERGDYKVLLTASDKGTGEVALEARPFAELNGPDIPRMPAMKLVAADLDDFQQRSYWLDVPSGGVVAIEAAGRNLADLRLWQDGSWLVDVAPAYSTLEPEPGRPLTALQLVARLNPGLYLLTAYGGPARPWSKAAESHPFYVRLGFPQLSGAGRQAFVASPLGVDRFLVPASANYFRLELPQGEPAELTVSDYDEDAPFAGGRSAGIGKESLPPVAEIREGSGEGLKLVTVRRDAGRPYVLQHFLTARAYFFDGSGRFWLSTIHSGAGVDSIDATVVLTARPRVAGADDRERIVRSTAPQLDPTARWHRRFNLLARATAFFDVVQPGVYRVEGAGAAAEYRFEPLVNPPENYEAPAFQPSGHGWRLERGHYVLTILPKEDGKGILELTVSGASASAAADTPASTAVTWPDVTLDDKRHYTLYVNEQPGVTSGIVLRRLPVDLLAGLPVTLKAGETLDLRVTTPGDGTVETIAEDGSAAAFAVDHGAPLTAWPSEPGEHVVTLRNDGSGPATVALRFTPQALAPDTPLPPLTAAARERMLQFETLEPGRPTFLDLDRSESRSFAFMVVEPALYRLETTGLLQTEGTLRTRTVVALDRQERNGVGRNFLIQQYLGEGDYQSTVAVQGETRGHLGLQLARTAVGQGGTLTLGMPARRTLAAGEGLAYSFTIAERGVYRLRALGLDRSFTMRLEDADGWPLVPPGGEAYAERELAPGEYRIVILPQPVEAKVVTLLEAVPERVERAGHGPHDLAVGETANHRWLEPAAGAERAPDLWDFAIAAPLRTTIELSAGMRGTLLRLDADGPSQVAELLGGAPWQGELSAGTYRAAVRSGYPNNQFDYWIALSTEELAAGLSRTVAVPADLLVSVGSDAVVEIGSFGDRDVRAWLYDSDGALVATNDDRANDWNFAIAGRFAPGRYRLHVEPVGAESADTTVSVSESRDVAGPALQAGEDVAVSGAGVHVLPLTLSGTGDLLVIAATAGGAVIGLTLEQQDAVGWRTVSESIDGAPWLAVPLPGAAAYRLRAQLADGLDGEILIQSRRVSPKQVSDSQWLGEDGGVTLQAIDGIVPALRVAQVALDGPGSFRLRQDSATLRWSTTPGKALVSYPSRLVFAEATRIWLADRAVADGPQTVSAEAVAVDEEGLRFTIPGTGETTVIDSGASEAGSIALWLAESRLGLPGLALGGERHARLDRAPGMAVADQSAVALSDAMPPAGAEIRLWNAGDAAAALPVGLRRFTFRPPAAETMDWGVYDIVLDAREAHAYALPAGSKRLRLALPPAVAVELAEGDGRRDIVWSGSRGLVTIQDTTADRLLLLPTAAGRQHFSISLERLAEAEAMPMLGTGRLFKQHFAAAGTVRLRVQAPSTSPFDKAPKLRAVGAVEGVTLVGADGIVRWGDGATVTADGTVDIAHGPGLVVAWVEGDAMDWLAGESAAVTVESASVVRLAGASQRLRFAAAGPRFLHLKTTAPAIVAFASGPREGEIHVFASGVDLSALLPPDGTELVLQSAGAGDLAGVAEVTTTAVERIGDGLGPVTRLAPGDSRLFSFRLEEERDVGVGVRGSADIASCRLLDASGMLLGEGVIQMHRLQPGTYLLAVDAPAAGPAVELQPVLVGAETPDSGPPDEIKRRYLELAGLKPKT